MVIRRVLFVYDVFSVLILYFVMNLNSKYWWSGSELFEIMVLFWMLVFSLVGECINYRGLDLWFLVCYVVYVKDEDCVCRCGIDCLVFFLWFVCGFFIDWLI